MKVFTVACSILLNSIPVFAGNLETVIAPPAETWQSGQSAKFSVYIHNTGKENVNVNLPGQVTCRFVSDEHILELAAYAIQPFPETPALIGKSEFLKVRYALRFPSAWKDRCAWKSRRSKPYP